MGEERSPTPTRGFSAIALAIALRDVTPHTTGVGEFLADGQQILLAELERGRGDDRLQASYAVAVGLAGLTAGADLLMEIASDENADPVLRGHAVVALGQVGEPSPEVQRVLFLGLAQRRYAELRRQSALGLALLGGKLVGTHLLRELRTGETEQLLSQVVIALGRLGDLQAVGPLATFATDDSRSELTQALAVVALGMLADPEPRPTLLKLTQHANYPARTSALHEAFTIL